VKASAIRIGLALNCDIAEWCRFARKNYFYPDMPKNFQTSQYDEPIAFDGWTEVEVDGESYRIEIEQELSAVARRPDGLVPLLDLTALVARISETTSA